MTYLNDTHHSKNLTFIKPKGYDPAHNLSVQYDWLERLKLRIETLSDEASPDDFNKLSTALSTTQKCFIELGKSCPNESQASKPHGDKASDRAEQIAELCKLVSNLQVEDYDPDKLSRRAAMIAKDFNATFHGSSSGGEDDDG